MAGLWNQDSYASGGEENVTAGVEEGGATGVLRPGYSPITRIFANVARLVGGKAAAGVISLGYLALAARTLGAEGYGVLVLVNAYALLIGSIVAFSGFHGVVRYGALAIERGDRAGLAASSASWGWWSLPSG